MSVTVAVDAMGGDYGPPVTVPACFAFLEALPQARVVLVGALAAEIVLSYVRTALVALVVLVFVYVFVSARRRRQPRR